MRFKTFTNQGGDGDELLPGDLNAIQDDYESAFSTWKTLARAGLTLSSASGTYTAGNYFMSIATAGPNTILIDPADLAAPGPATTPRALRFRLKVAAVADQQATGMNVTYSLFTANGTTWPLVTTPIVASQLVAPQAQLTANAFFTGTSSPFSVNAAGAYILGVTLPATLGASRAISSHCELQYRQVA